MHAYFYPASDLAYLVAMSYTIKVRITNKTSDEIKLVESSVWMYANGGTWEQLPDNHKLVMGGSGTSGMLRFQTASGEYFAAAFGIHNYAPWSGIAVDLKAGDTLQEVHKTYYAGGSRSSPTVKDSMALTKTGKGMAISYEEESSKVYVATFEIVKAD